MTLTETVVPDEQHAAHLAGMRRFREGAPGTILDQRIEVTARRRDGERFPVELTVTAEVALYHALGHLPEPKATHRFC